MVDQLEHLSAGHVVRSAEFGQAGENPLPESFEFAVVNGLHGRFELADVRLQRIQLQVDHSTHILRVVRLVGLPQQEGVGPMVWHRVLFEEVRIASCDDPFAGEESGVAVVGMQAISLPRVMSEHHTRSEFPNGEGDAAPRVETAVEFAVDVVEEPNFASAVAGESTGGLTLFDLASSSQGSDIDIGVPCPF